MSMSPPFRTADEAAVDALLGILPKSIKEQHEYGGYIVQIGSGQKARFFYTIPLERTSQPEGGTQVPYKPLPGAKLIATCIRIHSTRTRMARKVSLVPL
jgi:hypothetical protein